ncbi:MFS transporter [Streptosporangium lutulentum]
MATATPANTTAKTRPGAKRSTVAAVFGNYIEYVDFGSYGFMAAIIGANFFPGDASAQLLSSLAVFGVTFFFRPVGGVLWGYVGDRYGRKNALVWAIVLMSLSTALIGVLPNYTAIGIAAPILLVLLRSLQGISIGGEFAGAGTFITETAPPNRRGVWSSYISVSAALGTLTASTLVLALTVTLTSAQMSSWGWRIPFLLALPIGVVALVMRAKAVETEVFVKLREKEKAPVNPFKGFGKEEVKSILIVAVFASAASLGIYYFFTYFNVFLSTTVGLGSSTAIGLTAIGLILYSLMCPFAGLIGDLWGRKRPFVISLIVLGLVAVPVFMLLRAASSRPSPPDPLRAGAVGRQRVDVRRARRDVPGAVPHERWRDRPQHRPRPRRWHRTARRRRPRLVDGQPAGPRLLPRRGGPPGRRDHVDLPARDG